MKLKRSSQEQLWAEAQRRCPLSDEAVRMARELGLSPRSLIKNIPSPRQQWKAPVEDWVRDIYAKRHGATSRRAPEGPGGAPPQVEGQPWVVSVSRHNCEPAVPISRGRGSGGLP